MARVDIKYAHNNPTTRPANQPAPTKRTLGFHLCTSTGKKRHSPWEEVLGSLQVIVNHSLLHVDQNVRLGRLPWVWPPGSNHDVGQAQHYTQSLCNNHPFAFIAYCLVRALLLGCPFIYVSSSFNHKCIKKLQFVRYCWC